MSGQLQLQLIALSLLVCFGKHSISTMAIGMACGDVKVLMIKEWNGTYHDNAGDEEGDHDNYDCSFG